MVKIIDVSYHNGNIDFGKVKVDGIDGVIIRAGYGNSTVDKKFVQNITRASAAGLNIGIYWFSYAYTATQAMTEAKKCLNTIAPYKEYINLPIFFDWEYDSMKYAKKNGRTPSKREITEMCAVFAREIERAGYKSGIYLNEDYRKNFIVLDNLSSCAIWYARYNYEGTLPIPVLLWQYTSTGRVKGISGNVDISIFYGTVNTVNQRKTNFQVALEVKAGLWGNGLNRKRNLELAGYKYKEVQAIVNSFYK